MPFDSDKRSALNKEDQSRKGSIDNHIKPLCDLINSRKDFYTTSSCSGRTVVIKLPQSGRKNESEWLYVSHDKADKESIQDSLRDLPEDEVWFRYEPFILHVAAKDISSAARLLKTVQSLGIKRSGIISIGDEKVVIEIIGSERIDTIISKENHLLVSDDYLALLVGKANRKWEQNIEAIGRLYEAIKNM
ncbi:hypothetical protein KY363_02770 [Candidatus Woesearchaeota archaeon]|nr:hypothetical protein [Candidatus Woesearchaeota archaeon]